MDTIKDWREDLELKELIESGLPESVRGKTKKVSLLDHTPRKELKREDLSPNMPEVFANRLVELNNYFLGRTLATDHPAAREMMLLEYLDEHLIEGGTLEDFDRLEELRQTAVGTHFFRQ